MCPTVCPVTGIHSTIMGCAPRDAHLSISLSETSSMVVSLSSAALALKTVQTASTKLSVLLAILHRTSAKGVACLFVPMELCLRVADAPVQSQAVLLAASLAAVPACVPNVKLGSGSPQDTVLRSVLMHITRPLPKLAWRVRQVVQNASTL